MGGPPTAALLVALLLSLDPAASAMPPRPSRSPARARPARRNAPVRSSIVATGQEFAPAQVVTPVLGFDTEVVRLGNVGDAPYHIVYVPGNPGIPSYYESTCVKLGFRLNATAAIVGLRGHSVQPLLSPTAAFDLPTQVEHVRAFLQSEIVALRAAAGKASPRLIVIGHSIGAYIGLSAAMGCADSPRDEVACALGLMPYLDNTGIEANWELRSKVQLASSFVAPLVVLLLGVFAQLLGALPAFVRRALLRGPTSKFDPPATRITERSALSFRFINNALTLFRSEAANHGTPFDYGALQASLGADSVGLYYVDDSKDFWAAGAMAERAASEGMEVRFLPASVPHAFSTAALSDLRVAQVVSARARTARKSEVAPSAVCYCASWTGAWFRWR